MKDLVRRLLAYLLLSTELFCPAAFAQKPELVAQTGHSTEVTSIAFSCDGKNVASGAVDALILWDVASGKQVRTLRGHERGVTSVAFSCDGVLASAGVLDDTIKLWDVRSGKEIRTLTGFVHCVAFDPDGKLLAGGGREDNFVTLWDVATGEKMRSLAGHTGEVNYVAFSPDGKILASGSRDKTIKLWDLSTGRLLRTLIGHGDQVVYVGFAPDSKTLVSGGLDSVKWWEVATGREIRTLKVYGASVALDPSGKMLATGSTDVTNWMSITLFDAVSGREIRSLAGQSMADYAAFSPDGKILISGASGGLVVWDVGTGRQLRTLEGLNETITSIRLSSDSRFLASGTSSGKVEVWDLLRGGRTYTLSERFNEMHVAFSPDGTTLAATGCCHTVNLHDAATGSFIRTFGEIEMGDADIYSVAFSPDGKMLALGDDKGTVTLWDVATGERKRTLTVTEKPTTLPVTPRVKYLAFSSDCRSLVSWSVGTENVFELWKVSSGEEIRRLIPGDGVYSVALSPDGRSLAIGMNGESLSFGINSPGAIRFLDLASGKVRQFSVADSVGPTHSALAFSSDGRLLASEDMTGAIKLWDSETGDETQAIPGNTQGLKGFFNPMSLSFLHDGRILAGSGGGPKIILWDVMTGRELCELISFPETIWAVLDPAGRFDTNDLDEIKGLSWVFPDEPLRALAPEIFMRDYYRPKLLPSLLGGEKLPEVRSLSLLNRAQPRAEVVKVELGREESLVSVTVQVTGTQSRIQKDSSGRFLRSGAFDLRLFRDGQLVGKFPQVTEDADKSSGATASAVRPESWRKLQQIQLVEGKYAHTFSHIQLPQRLGVKTVWFTAYAFNSDRVKSVTTPPYEYEIPKSVRGQSATRRAYLVTMGVNANQSHNLDLELAVSSAERVRTLLRAKLQADYSEVVEIPLYSDLDTDSNQIKLKTASKANLRAVLDLLAGRSMGSSRRDEVDPKHQLRAAGPDDAVALYVASHGYADPQGTFYLMPYDTGPNWGITEDVLTRCHTRPDQSDQSVACKQAQDLLSHSVSSGDLTAWWNGVDAGEMLMILDSCHSGAVPGKEFRPAPLGDPGFGQLSYDKAMVILSASQPAQTARGAWVTGGEGRTLLVNALEDAAEESPDKSLVEWVHDAEQRLPRIAKQLYPTLNEGDVQIPLLLDFSRESREAYSKPRYLSLRNETLWRD
jgi:WD40 repeat protein